VTEINVLVFKGVNWNQLAVHRVQWQALVNITANLQFDKIWIS
jgi:hypothetical protein